MIDIFFGCAADVAGQSFVDDGGEDYAEKMEDGGKSGEVRRSARLEKLKHVRETEEGFVTPKRRKTTMQIGGQGTEGGKEKGRLLHVIPILRVRLNRKRVYVPLLYCMLWNDMSTVTHVKVLIIV